MLIKTLFVTLALLLSIPAHAGCWNNAKPGGNVWPTTDPHVYLVYVYDQDNFAADGWVRLFFYAGRHSRDVYVRGDRAITLPAGTTSIYAVNLNTCGGFVGASTDTWLRTVVVP